MYKRGYQIENTKIHKKGDSSVFEIDSWYFHQMLHLVLSETSQNFSSKEKLELVSKELNHLAAILHVYARGLIIMK